MARTRHLIRALIPGRNSTVFTWIAVAAIVATTFLYNRWMLDSRTFFVSDDWQWLVLAEFIPWNHDAFNLLPSAIYNDRPMGFAFIKLLYQMVGINHRPYQFSLLCLHALNCLLLYAVATRYIERSGALLAAILAAVWFSANAAVTWPAAIFDVLGATFCLSIILLRQFAIKSCRFRYDIAGAVCYILAIRTKEFALGMIALLVLMNLIVERQTVRATLRQLIPYAFVFGVFAIRYAQLLSATDIPASDRYHLDFSIRSIAVALGFYIRSLFYTVDAVDTIVLTALVSALGLGIFFSVDRAQRAVLFGLAGFTILLGPTLLIPAHLDALYLYAPHFFMALVVGALLVRRPFPSVIAVALTIAILVPPAAIHSRAYAIDFSLTKGEVSQAQFYAALRLLTPLAEGTTIIISGVEPFFNPFSVRPGDSLKTAFKDRSLTVELEKPEPELIASFCSASQPRRFLRFAGTSATDVTSEIEGSCGQ